MVLQTLRLQNFRSYSDASFEFDNGVNIVVGPNGSGKTNLLEALQVLCFGNSFRGSDSDLIQFEKPWARLDSYDEKGQRIVKLQRQLQTVTKNFTLYEKPFKRLLKKHKLPIILFEPNHLRLLTGSPELRRELLDTILEQIEPGFSDVRRRYQRTLAQRNSLLKHIDTQDSQLFAWNIRLSDLGGQLAAARIRLIEKLNDSASTIYQKLSHSPKTSLELTYQSTCKTSQYSSSFLHILERQQELDIARGFTGSGPHRDDVIISLNNQPAQQTASRGETRSIALTLKIIELRLVEQVLGQKPILLLDDVFSELDGSRRRALTGAIKGYQTFITTTDADIVVQHFMDECTIIPLG